MNAARRIRRAALYVRVSTDRQTIENQEIQLHQIAERRGWEVVEVYNDAGISGAKGRKDRPGLDQMLNDASRRKFDVVMAWAIDRVGRSLIDLLGTIQHLDACGVDLYLDQQNIDTTTPMGKLVFQITGAFAEFERTMIQQRIHAGPARARKGWQGPGASEDRSRHRGGHPRRTQEGRPRDAQDRGRARGRHRNGAEGQGGDDCVTWSRPASGRPQATVATTV